MWAEPEPGKNRDPPSAGAPRASGPLPAAPTTAHFPAGVSQHPPAAAESPRERARSPTLCLVGSAFSISHTGQERTSAWKSPPCSRVFHLPTGRLRPSSCPSSKIVLRVCPGRGWAGPTEATLRRSVKGAVSCGSIEPQLGARGGRARPDAPATRPQEESPPAPGAEGREMRLAATYSPTGGPAVPSARRGLTAVFGKGTGVSPVPWPPTTIRLLRLVQQNKKRGKREECQM